jgi:hypothetical protein
LSAQLKACVADQCPTGAGTVFCPVTVRIHTVSPAVSVIVYGVKAKGFWHYTATVSIVHVVYIVTIIIKAFRDTCEVFSPIGIAGIPWLIRVAWIRNKEIRGIYVLTHCRIAVCRIGIPVTVVADLR